MASSKVMSSRSPSNPDLPRQSVPSSQLPPDRGGGGGGTGFGSMNMEEILKSFYSDSDSMVKGENGISEMMSEMVNGEEKKVQMTLEDYLAKAGAVAEEDVRVPAVVPMVGGGYGMEGVMVAGVPAVQFGGPVVKNGGFGVEFGNGGGGAGGRGKRRAAVEDVPLDKATQQKQRRMIKNRESAARSRERKQAYTIELESLVTQLEEENARLLKEEEAMNKERYKQLMETLVPVTEQRRPPRVLRRTHSMEW